MPKYNRSLTVAYAKKFALEPNPRYWKYSSDCTNFVSQCLWFGGWPMITGAWDSTRTDPSVWWYGIGYRAMASHTWTGAHNFMKFLEGDGSKRARQASRDELDIGDVVQLVMDGRAHHTMIVTGVVSGATGLDFLMSYHTTNRLNHPLSKIEDGHSLEGQVSRYWKLNDVF